MTGKRRPRSAPRRQSFAYGFAFGSVTFFVGAFVSLASAIATARLYGEYVIGQYALAYAPTAAVWVLSTVQEQPALVRRLAALEPRAPQVTALWLAVTTFSQALTLVVSMIAAGASVIVFDGPLHHPALVAPALAMLGGYLIFGNPGWNVDTIFASFRAASNLFNVRMHQAVMFVVLAVAFGVFSRSIWGLAIALIGSYATSMTHRMILARRFLTATVARSQLREGFAQLRGILRFGLRAAPGAICSGVSGVAGTWILGGFVSVATVGGWSRALTVNQRLNDINYRVADMLLPTLVERHAGDDVAGRDRALVDSMRYVATLLLLPAAVAGGAASGVLSLLFGRAYANASGALVALLLVPVALGVIAFGSQALWTFNRPVTTSALEGTRLVITLAAGVALTAAFGATGMGAAMLLGCVGEAIAVLVILSPVLGAPLGRLWPLRSRLALLLSYAAGFAVARGVATTFPGVIGTCVAVLAGTLVYVACLLGSGGLVARDRERWRTVLAVRRQGASRAAQST